MEHTMKSEEGLFPETLSASVTVKMRVKPY